MIEASINHEKGYMETHDSVDIYRSEEPLKAYHARIRFCLDIHNHSIKAMRLVSFDDVFTSGVAPFTGRNMI